MRDITQGDWLTIEDEKQFFTELGFHNDDYRHYNKLGKFQGPGKYLFLTYDVRESCGCCYDYVRELVPNEQAIHELEKEMEKLNNRIDQIDNLRLEGF